MNFGKNTTKSGSSGNAMVYVLLALGLIGLLTATITRQDDAESGDISQEQAEFLAAQVLEYAASAQSTVDQMIMSGTDPDDIDFILPSSAGFNTAPHYNKLYHPSGGGLNYKTLDPSAITEVTSSPAPGYYVGEVGNVEWSPSTATEIVFAAYQISKPICESINKKITGSITIPAVTPAMSDLFLAAPTWVSTNQNLTTAHCAGCVGYASLCVSRSAADAYTFYSVIVNR